MEALVWELLPKPEDELNGKVKTPRMDFRPPPGLEVATLAAAAVSSALHCDDGEDATGWAVASATAEDVLGSEVASPLARGVIRGFHRCGLPHWWTRLGRCEVVGADVGNGRAGPLRESPFGAGAEAGCP